MILFWSSCETQSYSTQMWGQYACRLQIPHTSLVWQRKETTIRFHFILCVVLLWRHSLYLEVNLYLEFFPCCFHMLIMFFPSIFYLPVCPKCFSGLCRALLLEKMTTNTLFQINWSMSAPWRRSRRNTLKRWTGIWPSVTNNMFCVGVPQGGKDSWHI